MTTESNQNAANPSAESAQKAQTQKGSANPDHQGGKVESTQQPAEDGAVAATEDEKAGSSD